MTRECITPKYPMFADRWYTEMGESRHVKRVAGKAYAVGEDGKLVQSTQYVVNTSAGTMRITDGDWLVYLKTDLGDEVSVLSPKQFEATFKNYIELEFGKKYTEEYNEER